MCLQAKNGNVIIVTSAITITEVNRIEGSTALPKDQSKAILDFFENSYIAIRTVDRQTAEVAHEYIREFGLTNLDAIHVATATIAKVPVLYTYDGAGKKPKRRDLLRYDGRIGTPPLRIERPPKPGGPLFNQPGATQP
jgi:predicted nucleic acid-binding protein